VRAKYALEAIVGRSPALAAMLREVALVIPLDVSVLLTGASGTGKSQLARAIHEHGPRAGGPFVELNCAALPETLLESELFGALPGAHSTASRRIEGKVAAAERGTLLLDEIAEIPSSAQAKLLQLLQSRHYYPLGGARPVAADVRVIAATNTDLPAAVAARRFREDLYYRLNVMPIRVPTLAERREDIPALAVNFVARATQRHRFPRMSVSAGALRALDAAEWPGNVRQLENLLEAAVIRAAGANADVIQTHHIFAIPTAENGVASATVPETFQEATRRFQAQLVRETLEDTGWNVIDAAKRLDLTRSHVYNLIRAFNLERDGD
jgi:Nif-specific regulatory protein